MRALLALLLLLATAAVASAQTTSDPIDQGSFIVYLKDQPIGAETFAVIGRADSINSSASSYRKSRSESGELMIEKQMVLTANRNDFSLRFYQSNETRDGVTLITGVLASEDDTVLTVFREQKEGAGVADRLVAPPGRLFVLDSGLYTLLDLICIGLHGKVADSRPITLLTLNAAARDTVVEATVTNLGTETIRWGQKPVQANKLKLVQGSVVLTAWTGPAGKLLRLSHEATGLRVERDAPAVKRRTSPQPKPGG